MLIKECKGYELEKEKKNTSEDYFNRSELTFVGEGVERTLHVLYLRYFDEIFPEFTPFKQDPIFANNGYEVNFKDIVALVCLLKRPELRGRKRLYINSKDEFAAYFQDIHFAKLTEIFTALQQKNGYELRSPLEFIMQPQ